MAKKGMWYGCSVCGFKPEKDEEKSGNNWEVYTTNICPNCELPLKNNYEKNSPGYFIAVIY